MTCFTRKTTGEYSGRKSETVALASFGTSPYQEATIPPRSSPRTHPQSAERARVGLGSHHEWADALRGHWVISASSEFSRAILSVGDIPTGVPVHESLPGTHETTHNIASNPGVLPTVSLSRVMAS